MKPTTIICDQCGDAVPSRSIARELGWRRRWRRMSKGVRTQYDLCRQCLGKDEPITWAHCPFCPFCATEAPILWSHTEGGTLHWHCRNTKCGAQWRLQVEKTPADYGEPLPMADDDHILGGEAFYRRDELRRH